MAKTKKQSHTPISKERQALFTKYNVSPERQQSIQNELANPQMYDSLVRLHSSNTGLPLSQWGAGKSQDEIGNLFIIHCLERERRNGPDVLQKMRQHQLQMREKYVEQFQQVFGLPLSRFWSNITGFDVIKFDDDVIKSGEQSALAVTETRYGKAGVDIIKGLLSKANESSDLDA